MWRDYVGLIPSTAAVVNGFIAVLVAQFFRDHPIARIALVVAAGVLGAAAIGATFYGQSQIIAEKAEGERHRHMLQDALGSYIERGNALKEDASDPKKQPPNQDADKWNTDVINFLQTNMGTSYVTRYNDQTGISPLRLNNTDDAHQRFWWAIYTRIFRLEQFSQELPY